MNRTFRILSFSFFVIAAVIAAAQTTGQTTRATFLGWDTSGKALYFRSNVRDEKVMDVYRADTTTDGGDHGSHNFESLAVEPFADASQAEARYLDVRTFSPGALRLATNDQTRRFLVIYEPQSAVPVVTSDRYVAEAWFDPAGADERFLSLTADQKAGASQMPVARFGRLDTLLVYRTFSTPCTAGGDFGRK
jgi:hypothetical protein